MQTEIENLLKPSIVYNRNVGHYTISRKLINPKITVLSKHGNRMIIKYKSIVYRVKFRDFSATLRPEPRFENDLKLDYSLQFNIVELDKKESA